MEMIDQRLRNEVEIVTFAPIGWKSLLQTRGGTSRILVLKSVVQGLCLERGMSVYSYVGETAEGRRVMVSYLDSKPRIIHEEKANGG